MKQSFFFVAGLVAAVVSCKKQDAEEPNFTNRITVPTSPLAARLEVYTCDGWDFFIIALQKSNKSCSHKSNHRNGVGVVDYRSAPGWSDLVFSRRLGPNLQRISHLASAHLFDVQRGPASSIL